MFRPFEYDVIRDEEKTVISVTSTNFKTAVILLNKCLKRFGNWDHDTDVKLWGKDRMLNQGASFSISIPAPKDRKHTRDPFTKEYVSGYFSGITEFLEKKTSAELAEELAKDFGYL